MTKTTQYQFTRMNQDIVESKHDPTQYYSAENIRFITNGDKITGAFAFEKGNKLVTSLPNITINNSIKTITYGSETINYTSNELSGLSSTSDQKIIGYVVARNSYILFSTNDLGEDCIWEVQNSDNTIKLLYFRNLNFSTSNPIQAIFNYENEDIQKIYWVDGINQLRFLNIKYENIEGNSKLIDIPANTLNFVGNVEFSQPLVESTEAGGNHTSGMIQYAYNLYRLNSSQSKLSPLSELISLDKGPGNGGGEVNESVGTTPVITINNIDQNYTHIKIYSIKYTSYNELPEVNLIDEREIDNKTSLTIYDDGSSIADLTIEELLFLGSNPIIPKHIESKDNILFPVNIKEQFFDLPSTLDMRAYSWSSGQSCIIYDNVKANSSGVPVGTALTVSSSTYTVPTNHDAINLNYNIYKYQQNGTTLGGEGKYIKYEIVQKSLTDPEEYRVFKDREIYRIGIQFYNNLGQLTPAKWIGDFQAPTGNLTGNYNTLKVTLKPALITEFNNLSGSNKPIGFKIIRANRTLNDRTIIDQGILSPTMFQVKGNAAKDSSAFESMLIRENYQDQELKVPSYLTRTFEKFPTTSSTDVNGVLGPTSHLRWLSGTSDDSGPLDEGGEVYSVVASQNKIQQTFLHSKLMNFYSPEILFDIQTSFDSNLKLKVVGEAINDIDDNGMWGSEIYTDTQLERNGGKITGGLNVNRVLSNQYEIDNGLINLHKPSDYNDGSNASFEYSFIAPSGGSTSMDFYQYYRGYNSSFVYDTLQREYNIYGRPEIAERGQGSTNYNSDPNFRYANSLQSVVADGEDANPDQNPTISGINSFGCRSGFIVLGNTSDVTNNRKAIEDLYTESNLSDASGILMVELVKETNYKYLSGIYSGNSYEDKKRTSYIEIGNYVDLDLAQEIQIDNPGDTFVQTFRFARIVKTDTEIYDTTKQQITEIVEYKTETSVDLKNRNDLSIFNWDSRFQPRNDEYHKYNRVYSQLPTLVKNNEYDFTFRSVKNFDTRIIASKTKIPNETVDSWTDILENTSMDLDGKYGPINNIVNFKDELYTFQDNAFAILGINPRVQTQASDGISIELGRGDILYDYNYISNKTGCINKWGVQVTKGHIYFLDGLNKTFYRFNNQGLENISTIKGLHKYFYDNLNINNLRLDNPINSTGVSIGYNQINNEIYLTYNNSWTICFNELQDGFSSFYSYNSPFYIYNKEKMITVNPTGIKTLYEAHGGDYNIFYDVNKASKITLLANPEPNQEVVFNNLEYRCQAKSSSNSDIKYTWENIRVYNEFQDSGTVIPKLRLLNRNTRMIIPRNQNSTDRIRNTWCFIELSSNNINKYSYTNHDILLYYNPRYVLIR